MARITFGFGMPPSAPLGMQIHLARFLDAMGFDNLWFPDHMLFLEDVPAPDPWSLMAAIAMRTRRVTLGSAVTDPHRVHPAVFAHRLATLDQLSRGRMILGLGTGEAMNLEPFGIPWDRRVARTKEFLQVLEGLLDSPDPFDFQGEFFQLRRARLAVTPFRKRHIPIYMAALGPKTMRLAARHADGWFPVVIPPQHYGEYFAPLADACRKLGRDPEQVERVAGVPLLLDPTGAVTEAEVEKLARPYAQTLVWPAAVRRMGMPFDPPGDLDQDYINANPADPESTRKYRELGRWIPREVLLKFVLWGDVKRLRKVLGDYVDAGATHFDVFNASPDPLGSTVTLATEVLPYFTKRSAPVAARVAAAVVPVLKSTGILDRMVPVPNVASPTAE